MWPSSLFSTYIWTFFINKAEVERVNQEKQEKEGGGMSWRFEA